MLNIEKMPFKWVKNIMKKIKDRQDELTRRKIKALEKKAYDYYLTLYLNENAGKVVFHPDLYLSGRIVCVPARKKAIVEVRRIVVQGPERINQCYKILLENARELEKAQRAKRA